MTTTVLQYIIFKKPAKTTFLNNTNILTFEPATVVQNTHSLKTLRWYYTSNRSDI